MKPRSELGTITRHAASVLVGQLAVMAFGVTDTIVAGRHSEAALAALAVGSAFYISVYVALNGVMQALLPIYAEFHGAGKPAEVGRTFHQSIYLSAVAVVLGMAVMLNPGPLLRWAQVPLDMQAEVQAYLAVLAAGLAPSLLFRLYSTLNQALGRPMLVTWLQIGSLAVKLPLSIWLVGGGAGVPAMGAVGCAWATFAVNYLMLAVALLMLRSDLYRPYRIWSPMKPPQWRQILGFARLGLPGGMAYLVEVTSFTLISLFVARLGNIATASHQIAANVTGLLYMVPLSMGIACSARVSYWIGAGQPLRARQLTLMSLRLNLLLGLILGASLFMLRVPLAHLYSSNDAVAALAAELLLWVAIYHVADASQASSSFLLRSYRVTLVPLAIYGIFLWGLGLLGGYELSYSGLGPVAAMQSPVGFWLAGAIALIVVAAMFALLLLQASARALQPSHRLDAHGRQED